MLVFGLISPHPPIILPEVGQEETAKVRRTIQALDEGVAALARSRPERLVIISPHEGHGFDVPIRFLSQQLPGDIGLEEILVTEPSYQYYFDLGRKRGAQLARSSERWGIVASGDLSHVLKADGPYGYHPSGPILDQHIVAAVQRGDAQALLDLDPQLLDDGAECGLRSILFLFGAFESVKAHPEALSYEGPFGVGYLVATFTPLAQSDPAVSSDADTVTTLARAAIAHYLKSGQPLPMPRKLPPNLRHSAAAFVSLHEANGELRGCIGTTEPTKPTLAEEIIANAVSAATRDPRFEAVGPNELANLHIGVDVLTKPSPVPESGLAQLNPKRDGLIVTAADGRRGVLLPDLDGVDTLAEQIAICREKAEISPNEPVTFAKFQAQRYEE